MLELISRKEALVNNVFASFIYRWQKRYDPREDPYMTEAGNYYDAQLETERYFSKKEVDEINSNELAEYERLRDWIVPTNQHYQKELLFALPYHDITVYAAALGNVLQLIAERLNSPITFLLDYSIPWLHQQNDYPPAKRALTFLRDQGVSEDFIGGIRGHGLDLADLAMHLFWIIRCNASLPYCWFSTMTDPMVGSICKYGVLHLECYSQSTKQKLEQLAVKHNWVSMPDCFDPINNGQIEGRELKL